MLPGEPSHMSKNILNGVDGTVLSNSKSELAGRLEIISYGPGVSERMGMFQECYISALDVVLHGEPSLPDSRPLTSEEKCRLPTLSHPVVVKVMTAWMSADGRFRSIPSAICCT